MIDQYKIEIKLEQSHIRKENDFANNKSINKRC